MISPIKIIIRNITIITINALVLAISIILYGEILFLLFPSKISIPLSLYNTPLTFLLFNSSSPASNISLLIFLILTFSCFPFLAPHSPSPTCPWEEGLDRLSLSYDPNQNMNTPHRSLPCEDYISNSQQMELISKKNISHKEITITGI